MESRKSSHKILSGILVEVIIAHPVEISRSKLIELIVEVEVLEPDIPSIGGRSASRTTDLIDLRHSSAPPIAEREVEEI